LEREYRHFPRKLHDSFTEPRNYTVCWHKLSTSGMTDTWLDGDYRTGKFSRMSREESSASQFLLVVFSETVSDREEVPTPLLVQLPHVRLLQTKHILQ